MAIETNQNDELNKEGYSFDVFIGEMKRKIESGTEKHGDFTQYDRTEFFNGLVREFRELLDAINTEDNPVEDPLKIADECIDVANLAYMLYWAYMKNMLELGRIELTERPWPSYRYEY